MIPRFKPFRIPFGGRTFTITNPMKQLWAQSDLARTGYPTIKGVEYMQRRAMGDPKGPPDRDQHVWLVLRCSNSRILKPNPSLFIREDPFTGR
jgi:hypothetical protein